MLDGQAFEVPGIGSQAAQARWKVGLPRTICRLAEAPGIEMKSHKSRNVPQYLQ